MTIFEHALSLVPPNAALGLGSGRAALAFVAALADRLKAGTLTIRGGIPTSTATAELATRLGVPLLTPNDVAELDLTVDGADEVDPKLNLIKGYGRALVREKIVAAMSRNVVILVGQQKLVNRLGARGKLPVEVVPFATAHCERQLRLLGMKPKLAEAGAVPFTSDNGNHILDCGVDPLDDPDSLDLAIRSIPGVVGTGLFLGIANTVLVGEDADFTLAEELHRDA